MAKAATSFRYAYEVLLDQCADLELPIRFLDGVPDGFTIEGPSGEVIPICLVGSTCSMLEQVLCSLSVTFNELKLLAVGESKEVRLLTPRIAVAKLLPSVYSFTNNRYGIVPGTERVRTKFCAELFRAMTRRPGPRHLSNAFLGLVDSDQGLLLAEHVVTPGNLEVRVKRYHIGSPLHRYRYTEAHETAFGGTPLARWSRFETPVVCFDWRNPLEDEHGKRLADEPLSDDYASIWIDDCARAKQLARDTFGWIEELFAERGLQLIDICFFIDRTGSVIFGEISPDCMRVRSRAADDSEALDKDQWRSGGEPAAVLDRYEKLYQIIFAS
ncbi:phosphoribosylaminoimidazolesuccinocarboxamide synthase [Mesorhizobium sp. L2C084A000]|uniref:phosphoribosylaminoimidazolesuccinocarboxamide synthase n=1 Tax=Mesorhizobium sp. L2C084A000 TaxID=1287116 RepID=UPI0012DE3A8B|nr:phosphoribosylaminoimidazolesuccinocarboxamide synthase [Mesorhizobium sp. L2C084A000]